MTDRLVREYVRRLLLAEEDYGGIGDSGLYGSYGVQMGMMGGWGGKSLASVFGSPFLDVAKTAAGAGKEALAQGKGLARTGVEATLSMVLPFVSGEYAKIAKETHDNVQRVKKDYQAVYKKNLDAFFNTDLITLAFFLNPAAVVAGAAFDKFMYHAPDAALGALGWFVPLSGQKVWNGIMRNIAPERVQKILKTVAGGNSKTKIIVWDEKNRRKLYSNVRKAMGIENDANPVQSEVVRSRPTINEEEDKASSGASYQQVVKQLLADPAIMQAMSSSEAAQKLRASGKDIISKKLSGVYELAKKVTSAPSFDALSQLTGQKLQGNDPASLQKLKQDVKERLIKSLEADVEALKKAGVDPDTVGLTKAYEKTTHEIHDLPVNTNAPQVSVPKHQQQGDKEDGTVNDKSNDNAAGSTGRNGIANRDDGSVHQKV